LPDVYTLECATFLAAWLHDEPDAPAARAIAERSRPQSGLARISIRSI